MIVCRMGTNNGMNEIQKVKGVFACGAEIALLTHGVLICFTYYLHYQSLPFILKLILL